MSNGERRVSKRLSEKEKLNESKTTNDDLLQYLSGNLSLKAVVDITQSSKTPLKKIQGRNLPSFASEEKKIQQLPVPRKKILRETPLEINPLEKPDFLTAEIKVTAPATQETPDILIANEKATAPAKQETPDTCVKACTLINIEDSSLKKNSESLFSIIENVKTQTQINNLIEKVYFRWHKSTMRFEMDGGDSWENIRYLVETKFSLSDCYVEAHCLNNVLKSSDHLIGGEFVVVKRKILPPGSRRYIPLKFQKAWMAPNELLLNSWVKPENQSDCRSLSTGDTTKNLSEDELLALFVDQCNKCNVSVSAPAPFSNAVKSNRIVPTRTNKDGTVTSFGSQHLRSLLHPSDYDLDDYTFLSNKRVKIYSNYKCRRCFAVGDHWEDLCPTWKEINFVVKIRQSFAS